MADAPRLNEEQKRAVEHGEGPLLIIAGAGTGKTTVVTERIKHLITNKKVPAEHILALTFTEKASREMETRVDKALPYGYTDMWIETFHAFCERILRQEAIQIGLNPSFTLMTEAENLLFLRKHLFDFELSFYRPLGNPTKFLQGMLTHFSRLKDDDITPEQYLEYAANVAKQAEKDSDEVTKEESLKTNELAHAFSTYESLKAKAGVMDFSDLISNTLKLFRERKAVLRNYQERFQYILVDEFQDTNYAQNEMAILLAGEEQNITVVGDDDQSIYRWRGAALANMLQFRSHFPKAEIISLTKNYRSTQNILDAAYTLIQHNNPDRLEAREQIDKKLQAMRGVAGDEVDLIFTDRGEEEAEAVADIIKAEVEKSNRPYNEFAILVRANDHSLPFQRALTRHGIPFQFLGPGHLFQQEEIKDLIAYLRVLANFEDNASLYRILTMPIFKFSERDIAMLMNATKKHNLSLFEVMERHEESNLTEQGKKETETLVAMIKKHLALVPTNSAGQILYNFIQDSGVVGHYFESESGETEKEAANISKFFNKLQSFEANREDASVFAVVDWIDLSMELGESPMSAEVDWVNNDAVNILTVHSSKGLEFPVVFVVNLVTQRFPSRDRKEQIPVPADLIREELPTGNENLQEERRLFYVASTLAKYRLYLTASRYYGDAKRERKLSPFVIEAIGEANIDKILKKQTVKKNSEQLTLLEALNDSYAPKHQSASTAPKPTLNTISSISYSQIQTFQMCPLHYKMRYILQVPSLPSPALSYGTSVHNTIRDFTQSIRMNESLPSERMSELLKHNWIQAGYSSKTHEEQTYKQAESMLIRFAETYLREQAETVAVEIPFQFPLGKVKASGRIDRVDALPDGRIEIIDYKTGSNIPTERKLKDDLQLTFYALAATEIQSAIFRTSPDEILLTLYYLDENRKVSTTRTKAQLEEAKEKIRSIISDIETSTFRCSGGILCKNCEFKMLCSTYAD